MIKKIIGGFLIALPVMVILIAWCIAFGLKVVIIGLVLITLFAGLIYLGAYLIDI